MRDGTKIYRCPSRVIRADVKYYIDLYDDYLKGWLPFRGTKSEQPVKMMQIFDIIESCQARLSRDREELLNRIADGPGGKNKFSRGGNVRE